jgi:L-2-hydroxyglutarate oxidase LhgO
VAAAGGEVRTGYEVVDIQDAGTETVLRAADGREDPFDQVIVCAGLHADRVAAMAGDDPDPQIVPFLGVHLTPRVDGAVMVGPNAVLALAREGYGWGSVSARDLREVMAWPGFRRFARRHWRTGVMEMRGSVSTSRFVAAARRYVPELTVHDVVPGPSGVRAQALGRDGGLVDDFRITRRGRVMSVRNAPSPAATSSLAIAEHLVAIALDRSDGVGRA